jgi:tetratricopeptide (TPR) repeat protein
MNFFKALFGNSEENSEEKKVQDEEKNFDVFKYDGVRALKMGEFVYAIKCFNSALDIKEDLEIRDYLSQALIHNNELLPAYEQLQIILKAKPDNQAVMLMMAKVTYMLEDYNAMADACEKAMLVDDHNPEVSYLYAQACIGQEDQVNAVAMLTKAISIKADYNEAYLLRGRTLLKMGDVNSADEDACYLIEHNDADEDALMLKAQIEKAKGEMDEAIIYYNKVVDLNPFAIEAYRERGNVKLEKGDKNGATEDMQKVLELDPKQVADVNGEYSAEGVEQKTKSAYRTIDPFGVYN